MLPFKQRLSQFIHGNSLLRRGKALLEASPSLLGKTYAANKPWAQHGEDVYLARELQKQLKDGFYVDVGANHPIKRSNTYRLYCLGMRGITIEPNRELHRLQKRIRPGDTHLAVGCGATNSEMTFYEMNYDVFSTYSKEEAERYLADESQLGTKLLKKTTTPILSLRGVLEEHQLKNRRIFSLLSIDTEGLDLAVLEGNDWDRYRPEIIIVEALGNGSLDATQSYLKKQGYHAEKEFGANLLYRSA